MSDAFWLALFAGIPGIIAACMSAYVALRQERISKEVHKIEVATNSMKDALVSTTEREALARGIKQGTKEEKDRPK